MEPPALAQRIRVTSGDDRQAPSPRKARAVASRCPRGASHECDLAAMPGPLGARRQAFQDEARLSWPRPPRPPVTARHLQHEVALVAIRHRGGGTAPRSRRRAPQRHGGAAKHPILDMDAPDARAIGPELVPWAVSEGSTVAGVVVDLDGWLGSRATGPRRGWGASDVSRCSSTPVSSRTEHPTEDCGTKPSSASEPIREASTKGRTTRPAPSSAHRRMSQASVSTRASISWSSARSNGRSMRTSAQTERTPTPVSADNAAISGGPNPWPPDSRRTRARQRSIRSRRGRCGGSANSSRHRSRRELIRLVDRRDEAPLHDRDRHDSSRGGMIMFDRNSSRSRNGKRSSRWSCSIRVASTRAWALAALRQGPGPRKRWGPAYPAPRGSVGPGLPDWRSFAMGGHMPRQPS